jgi:hypothetical protein
VQEATAASDVRKGTGVWRWNNSFLARCSNGHKWFVCKAVKGTYSENHKCDARCLNAKGNDCTCSCGGANHGRGHAVTVVQASDIQQRHERATDQHHAGLLDMVAQAAVAENPALAKPERTAGKHIGEVGQTIRGEVVIFSKRDLDASTLYTFTTTKNNLCIKWFAPSHANPDWPVGKVLTLRAKVKAHKEFRGFPETIVTYVEEVE